MIIIFDSSDIRPTFLFWARGRTVALMRGLNRPLLTKLIHQEVDMEIRQESRSMNVEVHFDSDKVIQACSYFICHYIDIIRRNLFLLIDCVLQPYIQCDGELAEMEEDATVKSIGMGNTNRLSSLSGLSQVRKHHEEDVSSNVNPQESNTKVCKPYITKFIQFNMPDYIFSSPFPLC